ncbi:MAG: antitoxin family protein [Desulfobacterales bacterium]|nr:antitoxin family protein [Desulfobacterales bacterium]
MTQPIEAIFDGKVFRPTQKPQIVPNTCVSIIIEKTSPVEKKNLSFLKTARSLNLDGPRDWSQNLETYLYEKKIQHES